MVEVSFCEHQLDWVSILHDEHDAPSSLVSVQFSSVRFCSKCFAYWKHKMIRWPRSGH